MGKALKKEGTYPKRDINTNRLQRITVILLAYIIHWNNVFIRLLAATSSILVHSSAIPLDSSGMAPFLQECVGHDKVLA
jgi:hypothetical protein